MTPATFDTLKFVQLLKKANIPEDQAEAIKEAFQEAHTEAELATKNDVALVQKDIEIVRMTLETKLAETKADLIRWVVGAGFLQTVLIASLILKLIK